MHFNFNWQAFNPRAGFRVIITIALAVVLADLVGLAGPIIALAALVMSMADNHGPLRERMINLVVFTLLLRVITAIAWVVTGEMWPVVITISLLTLLSGFALIYWAQRAMEASFMFIWLIILLPGIGSETLGGAVAATLVAGLMVMVVALIFAFITSRRHPAGTTAPTEKPAGQTKAMQKPHLSWNSPITIYAVSKTLAAGLATLIGWLLIGGHPFWATWAPLMIIKPSLDETARKGVNRVIGTVLGGLAGYLLITPISNPAILAILYLVSIFLQFATTKIHYSLMIFFLTLELVIAGALGGGIPVTLSLDRLVATIIGVIISFATVLILSHLLKPEAADASPPAKGTT